MTIVLLFQSTCPRVCGWYVVDVKILPAKYPEMAAEKLQVCGWYAADIKFLPAKYPEMVAKNLHTNCGSLSASM